MQVVKETLQYYTLRNVDNGKYLCQNNGYQNDHTFEFYDGSLKNCYMFESINSAEKVQKEYGNYEIRKVKIVDLGSI